MVPLCSGVEYRADSVSMDVVLVVNLCLIREGESIVLTKKICRVHEVQLLRPNDQTFTVYQLPGGCSQLFFDGCSAWRMLSAGSILQFVPAMTKVHVHMPVMMLPSCRGA